MDWAASDCDPTLQFDKGGLLGKKGKINDILLNEMLQHPHVQRKELPISVGPDDFPHSLYLKWQRRSKALGCSPEDYVSTLTEFSARVIALACKTFGHCTDDVIVRGSVQKNLYFMERLQQNLSELLEENVILKRLDDIGLDEESWDSVLYAMMGFLCIRGLYNFIPSCTGAAWPVVGGKICPANNYGRLEFIAGVH
jgi:anhydro-N-acetylmuramic acid kinase